MSRPDVQLFQLLADQTSVEILEHLLDSDDPLAQREIVSQLGISSGVVSKRMVSLELLGVIERPSSHAPYSIVRPDQTRALLEAANDLSEEMHAHTAEKAGRHKRERRKAALSGGHQRDREKETGGGNV
jgi:DNA-binding HxlR family transcriptional regulator